MTEKKKKKTKKKKWIHKRHTVVWVLAKPVFFLVARLKYGYHYEKVPLKEFRQSLILSNHQCVYDQFFVYLSYPRPLYFLATETLFSTGIIGKMITWLVAPIPVKKSTNDTRAVYNILQVIKEGGSIMVFPEGNRSYAGSTVYIKKTIASLAKKLKLPLVLYRIEGAYGVQPRWSDRVRKGRCYGHIVRTVEPEELANLSVDEIYEIIVDTLGVDDHENDRLFHSKHFAEHLERVIYVCPDCGLSSFTGKGNIFTCNKCNLTAEILPDLSLRGENRKFPYTNETEWYAAQENYIRTLDKNAYLDKPAYEDVVKVFRVVAYEKAACIKENVTMSLYSDRITFTGGETKDILIPESSDKTEGTQGEGFKDEYLYSEIDSMSVQNANILLLFLKNKEMYRFIGKTDFNAVKYVNFLAHYQGKGMYELTGLKKYEGENDVEFLGL